ncbi:hypothetical protein BSKO_03402 [Bryopsis sp. KO-2023]|nr:hypothetical protein BSKO_03402 [Bryopsis sp. KO-2023]
MPMLMTVTDPFDQTERPSSKATAERNKLPHRNKSIHLRIVSSRELTTAPGRKSSTSSEYCITDFQKMVVQSKWSFHLDALRQKLGVWANPVLGTLDSTIECFDLELPWCGRTLNWKALLDSSGKLAPDFVFDEEMFFPLSPYSVNSDLKVTLRGWKPADTEGLTAIVSAVLRAFRSHHLSKMKALSDSRLQFELDTVATEGNCELLLVDNFNGMKAHFGIKLDGIDVSELMDLLHPPVYGSQPATPPFMLYVVFPVGSSSQPEITIKVPPSLSTFFASMTTSLTPAWSENTCLAEYQPSAVDSINEQIKLSLKRLQNRSIVIDKLSESLGHALERGFGVKETALYLVAFGGTQFLLFLEIGAGFPEDKPSLSVQMVRRPTSDGPFTTLAFNRWSPRWSPTEMAKRLISFLKEEAPKLRQNNDI